MANRKVVVGLLDKLDVGYKKKHDDDELLKLLGAKVEELVEEEEDLSETFESSAEVAVLKELGYEVDEDEEDEEEDEDEENEKPKKAGKGKPSKDEDEEDEEEDEDEDDKEEEEDEEEDEDEDDKEEEEEDEEESDEDDKEEDEKPAKKKGKDKPNKDEEEEEAPKPKTCPTCGRPMKGPRKESNGVNKLGVFRDILKAHDFKEDGPLERKEFVKAFVKKVGEEHKNLAAFYISTAKKDEKTLGFPLFEYRDKEGVRWLCRKLPKKAEAI